MVKMNPASGALNAAEKDALLEWIYSVRAAHYATGLAAEEFKNEIVQPLPLSVEADPRKVVLGDKLFHDKRLSKDNTISCASCHDCLLYTSPSPRDRTRSRMPSSA